MPPEELEKALAESRKRDVLNTFEELLRKATGVDINVKLDDPVISLMALRILHQIGPARRQTSPAKATFPAGPSSRQQPDGDHPYGCRAA